MVCFAMGPVALPLPLAPLDPLAPALPFTREPALAGPSAPASLIWPVASAMASAFVLRLRGRTCCGGSGVGVLDGGRRAEPGTRWSSSALRPPKAWHASRLKSTHGAPLGQ